jgi:hypothetical protein
MRAHNKEGIRIRDWDGRRRRGPRRSTYPKGMLGIDQRRNLECKLSKRRPEHSKRGAPSNARPTIYGSLSFGAGTTWPVSPGIDINGTDSETAAQCLISLLLIVPKYTVYHIILVT